MEFNWDMCIDETPTTKMKAMVKSASQLIHCKDCAGQADMHLSRIQDLMEKPGQGVKGQTSYLSMILQMTAAAEEPPDEESLKIMDDGKKA